MTSLSLITMNNDDDISTYSTNTITINNNNYSNYSYYVEDTSEGCYRDISASLQRKLFTKGSYRKRSKHNDNSNKKLPLKSCPLFIWTINEKDIDYNELKPFQICNHYEGITTLTTKNGFCDLLKEMCWINDDSNDVSPRSYNLGDPIHRDEFIDDFRITAASNILKYITYNNDKLTTIKVNDKIIRDSINVITFYLRIKLGGEWPCVERNFWQDSNTAYCGLEDDEWRLIMNCSYEIADIEHVFHMNIEMIRQTILTSTNAKDIRINVLLLGLAKCSKQFCTDGIKNIWIVKAPEACRGVNMRVSYRLEDILECEKGMGGRTVQKYVENPLLAPLYANPSINNTHFAKFDLRVWVLVVSFVPLKAYIYPVVYGRRCGLPYDLTSKNFNDSLIHLTNFAIQKKSISSSKPNSNTNQPIKSDVYYIGEDTETGNTRKDNINNSNKPVATQTDLLVSYDEVINIIGESNWTNTVWPEIKRKIKATLEITKTCISARKNSFEFLGYDIIIDSNLNPWVLEVNMSPAMAHRTDMQSNVIANMAEKMIDIVLASHSNGTPDDANDDSKIDWELLVSEKQSSHTNSNPNSSSQEWRQVTISQNRPSSAKATRPSSANSHKVHQANPGIPIDFAIVGKSINPRNIDFNDIIINNFGSLIKIQKRAKIFVIRVRKYHHTRRINSIIIQKYIRRYLGQCHLFRLIQIQKAIIIQCCIRVFLSKQRLLFKIKTIDAITIQSIVRMRLARLLFIKKRKIFYMKKILNWRRRLILVYQRKKVFILVMFIRKWYNRRSYCKTIVFKYIHKNYLKRIYNANKMKKSLRSLMLCRKVSIRIGMKRMLKVLAYECVIKHNDMMEKRIEKCECQAMNDNDILSQALRDYIIVSDNCQDLTTDKLPDDTSSNSSDNSSPATSTANSPSSKHRHNERVTTGVHDNWNSIFENTTGIDMGLTNISNKKISSPVPKPVGEILCVEDFVAKHMSNSTNPVTNALNPKAKAYIRLLKRTLGVEYFNSNTNVKSSPEIMESANDEHSEKLSSDVQPLFTPNSKLAFLKDDHPDTNIKPLPDDLKESIQQMEIAMKYYDTNNTDTIVPQQPTSPLTKKVHKLRPKSATHRKSKEIKSNSDYDSQTITDNRNEILPAGDNSRKQKKLARPKSANQRHNDISIPKLDIKYTNGNIDNGNDSLHSYFNEMDKNHHNWVNLLNHTYGLGNNSNDYHNRNFNVEYGAVPVLPLVYKNELPTIETKTVAATKSSRPKSAQNKKSTNSHSTNANSHSTNANTSSTNTNGHSTKTKKVKSNSNADNNNNLSSKNKVKERDTPSLDPYNFSDDIYDFSEKNQQQPKKMQYGSKTTNKKVKIGFDDFFLFKGLM